jgi:hypothetical protein
MENAKKVGSVQVHFPLLNDGDGRTWINVLPLIQQGGDS